MKFYNPFKPHIVVDGYGRYRVRKWVFGLGWSYLTDYNYWAGKDSVNTSVFSTKEGAKLQYEFFLEALVKKKLAEQKSKIEKVVHD